MATATQSGEDLFRQAISAWESAVESGVKMQEESAKWLREMCCNSNSLTEWYNKGQTMAGETIAKVQENIDEAIRVINQQAESSVRLIQKALDGRQSESPADAKARLAEWWGLATESMRMNSQAVLKANSHMLATWSELAQAINSQTADTVSHAAQKAAQHAETMAQAASEHVKEMVKHASGE
jgi:predicted RNase H-like HicB family nuclease